MADSIASRAGEDRTAPRFTWDICSGYLDSIRLMAGCSQVTYRNAVRQFYAWLCKEGIERPAKADAVRYVEGLAKGHEGTTVSTYTTVLRLLFSWADEQGLYPDIAKGLKARGVSQNHKRGYLTAEQIRDVLGGIDVSTLQGIRDYSMIYLMVTGGMRCCEVSRADVCDLRNIAGRDVLYVQGKGRAGKDEYVDVVPECGKALRLYLRERGDMLPDAPLFMSVSRHQTDDGRLSVRSVSRIVKGRYADAGIEDDRLTAHSLRHSTVTLAIQSGVKLESVQQYARHADISTTMIYYHEEERAKNRTASAVAGMIFPAGGRQGKDE